jgi:hypothetical protein
MIFKGMVQRIVWIDYHFFYLSLIDTQEWLIYQLIVNGCPVFVGGYGFPENYMYDGILQTSSSDRAIHIPHFLCFKNNINFSNMYV